MTTSGVKIAKRQFTLRGLTMRNMRIRGVKTNSYTIGWDGEFADIVDYNANRKRDITNIPSKEVDWVLSKLGILIDKEFARVKDKTVKVG